MKITNAKHKNTKKNTRKLNIFKEQIHTNNIAFWFVQLCDPMAYSKIRPDSLLQKCPTVLKTLHDESNSCVCQLDLVGRSILKSHAKNRIQNP